VRRCGRGSVLLVDAGWVRIIYDINSRPFNYFQIRRLEAYRGLRIATVFTVLKFSEIINKLHINAPNKEFWSQHFLLKPIGGKRPMPKWFLKITNPHRLTATQANMSRLSSSNTPPEVLYSTFRVCRAYWEKGFMSNS